MQKKLYSNRFWFVSWFVYHAGIILAFAVSLFFTKGIVFDADYTNMMPSSTESRAAKIAEKAISANSNSNIFILASHESFDQAKAAAEQAYNLLKDESAKFKSLTLYSDLESVADVQTFLAENRFNLLDKDIQAKLMEEGGAEELAQNALSALYGGFSMTSLENLYEDPFLLDEANLKNYLGAISDSGTALGPKDGVLATGFQGKWYVMLRGELTEEGARLASKQNAVPLIYERLLPLEQNGVRYVFYGTTFHSHKSSSSATSEISIISTVSMIAVVLILLFVFRSGLPLFASVFSICASLLIAFCATHLFFGQIHMTALVFGTSLIGSCIDYSLHYFINWKATKELDTVEKIRRHIFNGLILSLISTELCFFMLIFAPFGMLKQMAVFSFTGILSTFLTVSGFNTLFKLPPQEKRTIPLLDWVTSKYSQKAARIHHSAGWIVSAVIFAATVSILIVRHNDVKIQNNITNLYKMEGRLKDDTIIAYQVLDYNPTSWLIVSGSTPEEVLQTEEELMPLIPDHFVCTARFIPSAKSQKNSVQAASSLVSLAPEQYEYIGFDSDAAEDFKALLETAAEKTVTPEQELPQTLKSLLHMLWIGEVDGKYYSIILPSNISDEPYYKELASSRENVYYENKVADVSAGLDHLTRMIFVMFAAAFAIIAVVMKFFYSWKDTLKIISIPVLSVLVIVTVFVLAGLKIEFFCITGVILVFGLGLDYVIYRIENKNNTTESFAITLSFITTAISFGALALSSFVPVHVIGLSIFSGLITAFVCAIL